MPRIIPFSHHENEEPQSSQSVAASERESHTLYPELVPEGIYLVAVTHAVEKKHTKFYGDKIILRVVIIEGDYAGKKLPMFFRISRYWTSRFYRAWVIANDALPSRNTRMSHRIFVGKVFKAAVVTVRPCNRIVGPDGKSRPGKPLPERCWYSRVDHFLSLEIANEPVACAKKGGFATGFPTNPLSRDEDV